MVSMAACGSNVTEVEGRVLEEVTVVKQVTLVRLSWRRATLCAVDNLLLASRAFSTPVLPSTRNSRRKLVLSQPYMRGFVTAVLIAVTWQSAKTR